MPNVIEMRIQLTLGENGQQECRVMGPLQDKVLCLGMLEFAKKAVFEAQVEIPRVVPAGVLPPGLVKS